MADKAIYYTDGAFDWSGGVDSSKVTTLASQLTPNGLGRNQLSWLNNATVRNGGIRQRTGWQPLLNLISSGYWQGGYMYEPDSGYPYLVFQLSGILYSAQLVPPYTVTDLTGGNPALRNPGTKAIAEMAFFVQGENLLVIQAGDYFTNPNADPTGFLGGPSPTLPLFWDGTNLRRSKGIQTTAPAMLPNVNELPAATCMDYYGGHIWYAQARQVAAGDMVGGPSGTAGNHLRDSILSVTENPLCFGGDGFSVPTFSGNIRALKHSANINASLGQGQFFIFTRKTIYSLTVPTTRTDWIGADNSNQPRLDVVQLVNGAVGDRCIVPVNGDLFYQSFEPGVRSLVIATRYFAQWANTPISQNENRALAANDRSLMRFSSGIEFENRMWQLVLPKLASDGENVVHQAVIPLDFDNVSNLATATTGASNPVWEGAYDGLQFVQLFTGDFGGLPRAVAVTISDVSGVFQIWELTTYATTENGDNRVTWAAEFPAFTWASGSSASNLEYHLKQLMGGECWIDGVSGTVDFDAYYRVDADPCWRKWMHTQFCTARNCNEEQPVKVCYPPETFQQGYVFPVVFPQPPLTACDSMHVRPPVIGYQFQVKVIIKGWCRIRGILLYAQPHSKPQYEGIACPTGTAIPNGMAKLPPPVFFPPPPQISSPALPSPLQATSEPMPPTSSIGIFPAALPSSPRFTDYSVQLYATGGTGPYTFTLASGTLPVGMALSSAGLLSGHPVQIHVFTFSIKATDSLGQSITQAYQLEITA